MDIQNKKTTQFFLKSCLGFLFLLLFKTGAYADVNFDKLYGSDLGMGVGARAIGLGGAFVSIADDPSAVYWNPAGLTDINQTRLFLSAEPVSDFSAASVVFSPEVSFLKAYDFKLGFSYIRRLRFRGDSRTGDWSGYPSHLLDLAMMDVGDNFSGKINSKTCDTRITMTFSPLKNKKLSFGINYIFLQ